VSELLWGKLIDGIPALLWVAFALIVYFTLRRPFLESILPRMSGISGLGIEITLDNAGMLLNKAAEMTGEGVGAGDVAGQSRRRAVLKRLDHAVEYLKGGRILWVDDLPANNRYLVELFKELGMKVTQVESTGDALRSLTDESYDLVISDIHRGTDGQAGIKMLDVFRENDVTIPVIIHAASFDPRLGVDPMIFGGTNRVSEVVNYVIDVMERARLADA
jgi:CheY-like chemotaxis protein